MTTKIGLAGSEATVPDPVYDGPYEQAATMIGASTRVIDGTRKRHVSAQKYRFDVVWEGLSNAELSTLTTELNRKADLSWEPPSGGDYTVQIDTYTIQAFTQDTWKVVASMEQV